MDNDVRIVVDAENKTAQAFGSAAKGAKTVGDAANAAARQLKDMEAKLDAAQIRARKLAEAEEKSADKARDLAAQAALLRREIAQSGDASGKLGERLDRLSRDTKIAALATDDYRRAANRASAEAREQARAYDKVADNARQAARAVALLGASTALSPNGSGKGGGGKGGASIFDFLPDVIGQIAKLFSKGGSAAGEAAGEAGSGGPYGLLAGIGLGTAGALALGPLLGGALGGATLLGAGGIAAGGGLAGAWMGDPEKYGARWSAMIDSLKKRWLDSSKQFGGPLDDSLKEADRVIRQLPIERLANAGKDLVGPLVQGAGGGITAAADGFADLAEKAKPVVDYVGPKLTGIGHDLGDAFRMIGKEANGGALALGDLVTALGWVVRTTGVVIGAMEAVWESEHKWLEGAYALQTAMPGLGEVTKLVIRDGLNLSDTSNTAGRALKSEGDAAAEAATGVAHLGIALDELRTRELAAKDASLALAQGWLDLNKSLKDGKRTLDLSTQAGIDHQKAIVAQVEAAEQAREQQIELTQNVDEANKTYAENIERIRQMAYAAGYNKQQVDQLISSIAAIPPAKTTEIKTPGLAEGLAQGIALGNALNNIDGYYTAHVNVAVSAPPGVSVGNLLHHAAGGPTSAGLSAVNDWGGAGVGEVMRLPNGSTVIPAGTGRQVARDLAAGGGGGGHQLVGRVDFSGDTDSAMAQWFMQAQREGKVKIYATAVVAR